MRLHQGEADTDEHLVRRLLTAQAPTLAALPLRRVRSTGTVNAVYRLGSDLCVRLPLLPDGAESLQRELTWLPRLADRLPLPVPEPVHRGGPALGFPHPWAVYRWIAGDPYADALVTDEVAAAYALAGWVQAMRAIPPAPDAPAAGRQPLAELAAPTYAAMAASEFALGADRLRRATRRWDAALALPAWSGSPVWIHTDLLRPNLLVDAGRLAAVLDFGGVGIGDPAADVIAAWTVLGPTGRAVFRETLTVDDATWDRACGYALHQAALIIPYYRLTNPAFVDQAVRTVAQILS